MHIEAVKRGGVPPKRCLIHDRSRPLTCAECEASYDLHYDGEAESKSTLCSILAGEMISARHPDHEEIVAIDIRVDQKRTPKRGARGPLGQTG